MAAIIGILILACLPGPWAVYILLIRPAPRPWAVRVAASIVFLSGASIALTVRSGGSDYPPEVLVKTLAAPVIFVLGPMEAIPLGAYASLAVGTTALLAWAALAVRLSRPLAFLLGLVFGAATLVGALAIEDRVQASRITQAAEQAGATCLDLRHSFSDTLALHWRGLFGDHFNRPSHAGAAFDGIDMIWSYRRGQFFEPRRPIACEAD